MAVIDVTNETFETEVLQAEMPVLADFWASWCGPCRMLAPSIDQIAEERADIKVVKIDIDAAPALAERYKVMSVPTLIVFRGGEAVKTASGPRPKALILKLLDE